MDLVAGLRNLGREVVVSMLAQAIIGLVVLLYYYLDISRIYKNFIVIALVILSSISFITTLWIAQNRKKEKEITIAAKRALEDLTKRCENKEFDLLIKPLYLAFEAYPASDSIAGLVHLLSMSPYYWNDTTYKKSKSKEEIDTVNLAIKTMRQYRELAQPKLLELINRYLDRRHNYSEYGSKYYDEVELIVKEIANLTKTRYNELISMK